MTGEIDSARAMMPPGWLRSKRGDPYLKKSGVTAVVYATPEGGFTWRIAAWRGLGAVDSPEPFPTELAAMEAASGAGNYPPPTSWGPR
jgi:hypothetical protein